MRRLKKAFNLITAEPLVEAKAPVLGSDGRRTVPVRSYLDTSPREQRLSELDKVRLVPIVEEILLSQITGFRIVRRKSRQFT
jgi:hypothetical protein